MARGLLLLFFTLWAATASASNSTYQNPVLPGWHSDPSCTFVEKWNQTFFCTTSSFLAFPGLPIYASKDLVNWKHISNAYNRREDIPEMLTSVSETQAGLFASTLRMHKGKLYILTAYISTQSPVPYLLWTTTNPFDDNAWDGPVTIPNPGSKIDPDLFWDDDGSLYVASSGLVMQPVRGHMAGPLPRPDKSVPGYPDSNHFVHQRPPPNGTEIYRVVSDSTGHKAFSLQASRANLTGPANYKPTDGQTFMGRKQAHTEFSFSIDVDSSVPSKPNQETGLTVFLTSYQHIDLGIIMLPGSHSPSLRLRTESLGKPGFNSKLEGPLQNTADVKFFGTVSAEVMSGGSGPFTGTLLGAYATTNGASSKFQSRVSRWNYTPISQKVE